MRKVKGDGSTQENNYFGSRIKRVALYLHLKVWLSRNKDWSKHVVHRTLETKMDLRRSNNTVSIKTFPISSKILFVAMFLPHSSIVSVLFNTLVFVIKNPRVVLVIKSNRRKLSSILMKYVASLLTEVSETI